jgi:hypothetical protein
MKICYGGRNRGLRHGEPRMFHSIWQLGAYMRKEDRVLVGAPLAKLRILLPGQEVSLLVTIPERLRQPTMGYELG